MLQKSIVLKISKNLLWDWEDTHYQTRFLLLKRKCVKTMFCQYCFILSNNVLYSVSTVLHNKVLKNRNLKTIFCSWVKKVVCGDFMAPQRVTKQRLFIVSCDETLCLVNFSDKIKNIKRINHGRDLVEDTGDVSPPLFQTGRQNMPCPSTFFSLGFAFGEVSKIKVMFVTFCVKSLSC